MFATLPLSGHQMLRFPLDRYHIREYVKHPGYRKWVLREKTKGRRLRAASLFKPPTRARRCRSFEASATVLPGSLTCQSGNHRLTKKRNSNEQSRKPAQVWAGLLLHSEWRAIQPCHNSINMEQGPPRLRWTKGNR